MRVDKSRLEAMKNLVVELMRVAHKSLYLL